MGQIPVKKIYELEKRIAFLESKESQNNQSVNTLSANLTSMSQTCSINSLQLKKIWNANQSYKGEIEMIKKQSDQIASTLAALAGQLSNQAQVVNDILTQVGAYETTLKVVALDVQQVKQAQETLQVELSKISGYHETQKKIVGVLQRRLRVHEQELAISMPNPNNSYQLSVGSCIGGSITTATTTSVISTTVHRTSRLPTGGLITKLNNGSMISKEIPRKILHLAVCQLIQQ